MTALIVIMYFLFQALIIVAISKLSAINTTARLEHEKEAIDEILMYQRINFIKDNLDGK
jgi:hypothetical protein